MAAADAAGEPLQRARAALQAGCDMILVCNHPRAARTVVEGLGTGTNPVSQARLIRLHGRGPAPGRDFQRDKRWQRASLLAASLCETPEGELNV